MRKEIMKAWIATALLMFASAAANAGTVTYFHNDFAGSPVVATNANREVIWRESYRPYGERLTNSAAAKDNKVWFTSRRQDADTGLVYMGARYYDPVLGRFISMDPVGFDEANLHSHNRYAYGNNNPSRYSDPDGKSARAIQLAGELGYQIGLRLGGGWLGSRIGLGLYNIFNEESGSSSPSGDSESPQTANSRNKPPPPLPEAEGRPHSIVETPGQEGQYTTHNGDGTWKQYRGSGKDHGEIPRPNVKEAGTNVAPDGRRFVDKGRVRPPRADEIPGG